jgi:hypothetical protein
VWPQAATWATRREVKVKRQKQITNTQHEHAITATLFLRFNGSRRSSRSVRPVRLMTSCRWIISHTKGKDFMSTQLRAVYALLFCFIFLAGLISSCASSTPPSTPSENYKGPIAERPMLQNGDFWVFEHANGTKSKTTVLPSNIEFPLWKAKTWSYASEALKRGQPATSKASRIPVRIECTAVSFKSVTVTAGTFEAYECECQCNVVVGRYDTDCGGWTFWYAPAVKNIIRTKTGSTDTSLELIQYRTSTQSSPEANRAVALIIDKSGSMADQKRIHYAKEAKTIS